MSEPLIVVTAAQLFSVQEEALSRFSKLSARVKFVKPRGQGFSSEEMVRLAGDADVLIAGDDDLDAAFFHQCGKLRYIIRWGVGVDSVDLDAARKAGVKVANTPGILGTSVAEYTMGLLLLLARKQHLVDRAIRSGNWVKPTGTTLREKNVGIIGYGNVGHQVGRLCRAFGMSVLWFDPNLSDSPDADGQNVSLDALATMSDFIVVSCPLNNQTRRIVGPVVLQQMKPTAYVVNVSRGGTVDEDALRQTLADERIAGAALDVFEEEPLPIGHWLMTAPNVILGSHNASNTMDGVEEVNRRAIQLAMDFLSGTTR